MSASFTPGPWLQHGYMVYSAGCMICEISEPRGSQYVEHHRVELDSKDRNEAAANARLIAAAPDLFEALQQAETLLNHMGDILNGIDAVSAEDVEMSTPIFTTIRAALAKATGGAA